MTTAIGFAGGCSASFIRQTISPKEDKSLAQELFADDLRKSKEKYGIPEWD